MHKDPRLYSRLSNCLQTILDLEPDLKSLQLEQALAQEFTMLKTFCKSLEKIHIIEEDVERIENATVLFLEELKGPLSHMEGPARPRIVQ